MSRPLLIFTAQMAKHHLARELGLRFFDTTYKTGTPAGNGALAPSKEMVLEYKAGNLPSGEYVDMYNERLYASLDSDPAKWEELMTSFEPVVVACYCPANQFCHRHPLVDFITKIGAENNVTVQYLGELTTKEAYEDATRNHT